VRGRKIPSGASYSIRLTPELMEIGRELGNGSVAEGIRRALRAAARRDAQPVPLSVQLRAAAIVAADLEERAAELKARKAKKRLG
jgi:hypothetical protein